MRSVAQSARSRPGGHPLGAERASALASSCCRARAGRLRGCPARRAQQQDGAIGDDAHQGRDDVSRDHVHHLARAGDGRETGPGSLSQRFERWCTVCHHHSSVPVSLTRHSACRIRCIRAGTPCRTSSPAGTAASRSTCRMTGGKSWGCASPFAFFSSGVSSSRTALQCSAHSIHPALRALPPPPLRRSRADGPCEGAHRRPEERGRLERDPGREPHHQTSDAHPARARARPRSAAAPPPLASLGYEL